MRSCSLEREEDKQLISLEPYLIGIAGPSSAGKSSIARGLVQTMPKGEAIIIGMDSYYRDLPVIPLDDVEEWNFDRPEAFDKELLFKQILALSQGDSIEKPVYSYRRHCREPRGETVHPAKFIIVEGLYTMYWPELRGLYLTSAFITARQTVCRSRKMHRDLTERNLTPKYSTEQYDSFVFPMYGIHIHPTRFYADILLDGEAPIIKSVRLLQERIEEVLSR